MHACVYVYGIQVYVCPHVTSVYIYIWRLEVKYIHPLLFTLLLRPCLSVILAFIDSGSLAGQQSFWILLTGNIGCNT